MHDGKQGSFKYMVYSLRDGFTLDIVDKDTTISI